MAEQLLHGQRARKGPTSLNWNAGVRPRWLAWLFWAAVGASAGVWALYNFLQVRSTPSQTGTAEMSVAPRGDSASPRGTELPPPVSGPPPVVAPAVARDRFRLVGVVASGGAGLALIAIDGWPARAFRVGAMVEGDLVLQQVSADGATLGPREGGASISLQASLPPSAATVAPPAAGPAFASQVPIEGSAMTPEALDKLGSKHAPLVPQRGSAPQKSGDDAVESADGKWTQPSVP